jgi:LruC domain-containing protein
MKHSAFLQKLAIPLLIALIGGSFLLQTSCRRTLEIKKKENPGKFTELQVDPDFEFESFINLTASIGVAMTGTPKLFVIQVFMEDPAAGGKLIASGATNSNQQFRTSLRVPSRLTELWIAKISPDGLHEYASVPITGSTINHQFGTKSGSVKSTDGTLSNDCSSGCTQTLGSSGTYTANSGQVLCVNAGSNLSLGLTINAGGTVRICGTANITSLSGAGLLVVSQGGSVTAPIENITVNIDNYGTINFALSGNNKTVNLSDGKTINNWGSFTISNSMNVKGMVVNNYHFTVIQKLSTKTAGRIINNCQFFVNSDNNSALSIVTGSSAAPGLVNDANAFFKVIGQLNFSGQGHVSLGSQSLIECKKFSIQGFVYGPSSQGSQIHATGTSSSALSGATATGYVDFWATQISPQNGTFATTVSFHNPGYTIPAQDCNAPVSPVITSSLTAAGLINQPITPYVITASGTGPITFTATNLPPGLLFNPVTHTITGTPTTAGVTSIPMTADNLVGSDSKNLVLTVTNPGNPPIITSALTGSATVNQSYTYLLTASGTGTITYNAINLPSGLTFDPVTHQISGTPAAAGVYNIPISATNTAGSDNDILVLTVGSPPVITSTLTANGIVGQQFPTYQLTAAGSGTITYNATNLPAGLSYNPVTHTINGSPTLAGQTDVTLTASSPFGNDTKILEITIGEGSMAPVITSSLSAAGTQLLPFTYIITADGTAPITFNATGLPAGLTFTGNTISGIPTVTGTFFVPLTATNATGIDNKNLALTILGSTGPTDTDGDGVADNMDAYPTDATRAFNSYYPNEVDFGSYAFEDLWPDYGDYDCNDLVVNFNYKIVTNAQNKVVDLIAKFQVMASGASFDNGFGLALSTPPGNVASVTGCIKSGSAVTIDPKGYESGHTLNTVIIPVDAVSTLLGGVIINTVHGGYTVQTQVQTVTVHLAVPQASIGTPPYNPFIFINQDRAKEVHMKNQPPTELANPVYFGTGNDGSVPAQGFYYVSSTGLPWAMEIPVNFDYPLEKSDIVLTYLHFPAWAQSSGVQFPDWYMDKPGYRVDARIY